MEYRSDVENLDEDGYTQLHFTCVASLPWRLIAVALGILCLIILVIAVVLGIVAGFKTVEFKG
uniref:Caveolin n=1 Tax=Propithecus coquereli TaxID=379532 RepID=A0A2K6GHN6_PROCO